MKEECKKRTRRGKPIRNKLRKFKVWFHNIRGIKSKVDSLRDKIDEVEPTVFCIAETHLLKTEDLQFEGYTPFRNDRENRGGGGIIIFVRTELEKICTIVEKGNEIGETLWVAIDNGKTKIRLGVIYAPQESRTSKEEYKILYEQIKNQILLARERQQKILLMGDFNCKIGNVIEGNKSWEVAAENVKPRSSHHYELLRYM